MRFFRIRKQFSVQNKQGIGGGGQQDRIDVCMSKLMTKLLSEYNIWYMFLMLYM